MEDYSTQPIVSPERRAAFYWFVDGLPEIVYGVALLLMFGAPILVGIYAPRLQVGALLWVSSGIYFFFLWKRLDLLHFLKSHVTYPRTGYVQPPEEFEARERVVTLSLRPVAPVPLVTRMDRVFMWRTIVVIIVFFWTGWMSYSVEIIRRQPENRFVPVVTLALAGTLYVMNRATERPYRWWSAAILAMAGLAFLWVDIPARLQMFFPPMLAGGWLVALGVGRLVSYLRENPYPRASEGGVRV